MAVLGYGRDDMLAVHLMKTYCLPIVLYGCEIWCMSPSDKHKVDVAWNNCFRKVLTLVGVKVLSHCYFIAILCLLHYWLNREKLFSITRLYIVTILFCIFCVLCIVMRPKNCHLRITFFLATRAVLTLKGPFGQDL